MTASLVRLAELEALYDEAERATTSGQWEGAAEDIVAAMPALIAVARAAQAVIGEDAGPTLQTADLNPYSARGRRQALRDALAALEGGA